MFGPIAAFLAATTIVILAFTERRRALAEGRTPVIAGVLPDVVGQQVVQAFPVPSGTALLRSSTLAGTSVLRSSARGAHSAPTFARLEIRVNEPVYKAWRAQLGQRGMLRQVRQALERLGFKHVRAVIQDPTDNEQFTALAYAPRNPPGTAISGYWNGDATQPVSLLQIQRLVPVEEPPAYLPPIQAEGELDPGLPRAESDAVRYALVHEKNPRHLAGFAATLEPYYPVGASLLRAKAMLRESEVHRNRTRMFESNREAGEALAKQLAERTGGPDKAAQTIQWVSEPAPPVTDTLSEMTRQMARGRWPDVEEMWQSFRGILPDRWYRIDRMAETMQQLEGKKLPDLQTFDLWRRIQALSAQTGTPLRIFADDIRYVGCVMLDELQSRIHAPWGEEVDRMSEMLAGFPPEVIELGRRLVREIGLGVWVLCPSKLREIVPSDERDGYTSPSALRLADGAGKPEMSDVKRPGQIGHKFQQMQPDTIENRIAKHEMQKAERALERRKWIHWYHQAAYAGRPLSY